ncbi:type II secretion system F family protein [Thiotrichales bacterium 19S3-7]|nr:type II secretion system F family protein [Thiotrichales bacterium 19S3-7]MCF6802945.1 type II secretion system F family protein [Thiotrichales bacterium 19S3-11]
MSNRLNAQSIFLWKGKDEEGLIIQGQTSAVTIKSARSLLTKQGITVISIRKQSSSLFLFERPIKPVDIAFFFRQMATMLTAGIPIIQALDMLVESSNYQKKLRAILSDIRQMIASGRTLSDSLLKHSNYFDILSINLIRAGEASGELDQMLTRIASYKEKHETLKKKVKKALYYPIAVLVTAIIVTAVMLIYVVPTFSDLFDSFGATLPPFTQMVIDLSNFAQAYWHLTVIIILLATILFVQLRRRNFKFHYLTDQWLLKIPIIGKILKTAAIARFSRTLATIFSSGMPMIDALQTVAKATGNLVYEHASLRVRTLVANGSTLHNAIDDVYIFPSFLVQMVAVGENSGNLEHMLKKVADTYEEDVDHAVDSLSSLIEPVIMVILGGLIGGLVVAMYLPIFQLGSIM